MLSRLAIALSPAPTPESPKTMLEKSNSLHRHSAHDATCREKTEKSMPFGVNDATYTQYVTLC